MGKILFIFVEGPDDERFFNYIKKDISGNYSDVRLYSYRGRESKSVSQFIQTIKKQRNADYIFVSDHDDAACITSRKEAEIRKYKGLEAKKILIVKKEIESWYLAGITETNAQKLGLTSIRNRHFDIRMNTDSCSKETCEQIVPKKFISKNAFLVEILKHFSKRSAKQKNLSFKYFSNKYC